MADWKTQLQQIQALRLARQQNDESLYAARIGVLKADSILNKATRKETGPPPDEKLIADLKARISAQQATILSLNTQINDTGKVIDTYNQNVQLVATLGRQIDTANLQVTNINKQILLEQRKPVRDTSKLGLLQKQLGEYQKILTTAQPSLDAAKKQQVVLQKQYTVATTKKADLTIQVTTANATLTQLSGQLTTQLNIGTINIGVAQQGKTTAVAQLTKASAAYTSVLGNLQTAINGIFTDPHPRSMIGNLDDSIPFLLMPVRIETRFVNTATGPVIGTASGINTGTELWLRVYPDDIAIHTHEKTLTDAEVGEGKKYWTALFTAEKSGDDTKEDQKRIAWNALADLFGGQRAAWIAKQTQPSNWTADLSAIASADQLTFPTFDLTKTDAWSRAPRTNIMPDKFVVTLYDSTGVVKEVVGNLIPDELFMGPDPMDPEGSFAMSAENTLVFGDNFNWTSDFDKAVACGMGFKIPLTLGQAIKGFDKIVVLGVALSSDETTSQQALEDLIDNHHYSTKGFSIVTQGTATNNTDNESSGYSGKDPYNTESYFVETGAPLFTESDGLEHDGKNLANALGIGYSPLQFIRNADSNDHREAVAVNTALYPATLGYYFSSMMNPVLNDASQAQLRDFFTQHVCGRGPLPAVRVGNQPYGVLLTSDFSAWQCSANEPVWSTPFLTNLQKVLNGYSSIYNSLLPQLTYTGKPGVDPSDALLNILGLQPGSVSFYQRNAYSTDDLRNRDAFQYGGKYYSDFINSLISKQTLLDVFSGLGYAQRNATGLLVVPQQLRLIFDHYHTTLDASNLVDSDQNYIQWLAAAATIDTLEKQDFGAGVTPPNNLLYMLLRRARLLEITAASVKWYEGRGIDVSQVIKPVNFYNIRSGGTLTKWEMMRAPISHADPAHPQKELAIGEYLITTGKSEAEAAYLKKMTDALGTMASMPGERLERCLTEHIDTCSYRLDAWQTGLFNQRLQKQRQQENTSVEAGKQGIYLGAYGIVENLRVDPRTPVNTALVPPELLPPTGKTLYAFSDNGGLVQTPSLNHAITAAILRSGYLSHADSANPDMMAVNLSSARVRDALALLEGVRNGQTVEALLGYQFERGLHDRGSANDSLKILNAYILNFRNDFPLKTHTIQQEGIDTPTVSIPAANVVNGLDLAETTKPYPYASSIILSALDGSLQIPVRQAIDAERNRLQDTLDAVKDLLLSESVFQIVQGNTDRLSAVTNALKDSVVPPEIDIVDTPRSSRLSFTNRVTVQFTQDNAHLPAWPADAMTARAMMETGLNNWIKGILGDAANLVCVVAHTDAQGVEENMEVSLDKLGVQPIDIIYMTGGELNTGISTGANGSESNTGASQLERRIAWYYRTQKNLDDAVPVSIRFLDAVTDPGKISVGTILPMIKAIKSVITNSRPLQAQDFCPISKPGQVDPANPNGYNLDDLGPRTQNAMVTFNDCLNALKQVAVGGLTTGTSLGDLAADPAASGDWESLVVDLSDIQTKLIGIAAYGIADAFPTVFGFTAAGRKTTLLQQAINVVNEMATRSDQCSQLFTQASSAAGNQQKVNLLTQAGKRLFGDEFTIIPLFTYNNIADMQLSFGDKDVLTTYAATQTGSQYVTDEWIAASSLVRPKLAVWDSVRTMYELLNGSPLSVSAVQLPYRAQDSWLAVEFPDKNADSTPFVITDDTISVVVHGDPSCFGPGLQGGLLIDDWTELIPSSQQTTGISFNYNQPNAMAPQALLLAVTPVETGKWSWDSLMGIVNDTFLRAKLRAVEPGLLDPINNPQWSVLLPAIMSSFSQSELDISLDFRTNIRFYADALPATSLAVN